MSGSLKNIACYFLIYIYKYKICVCKSEELKMTSAPKGFKPVRVSTFTCSLSLKDGAPVKNTPHTFLFPPPLVLLLTHNPTFTNKTVLMLAI